MLDQLMEKQMDKVRFLASTPPSWGEGAWVQGAQTCSGGKHDRPCVAWPTPQPTCGWARTVLPLPWMKAAEHG